MKVVFAATGAGRSFNKGGTNSFSPLSHRLRSSGELTAGARNRWGCAYRARFGGNTRKVLQTVNRQRERLLADDMTFAQSGCRADEALPRRPAPEEFDRFDLLLDSPAEAAHLGALRMAIWTPETPQKIEPDRPRCGRRGPALGCCAFPPLDA